MNLQSKNVQGQRICVITGKFLPTYAQVQVDEESGQIGLLFDPIPAEDANLTQSVFTNNDHPSRSPLQWYRPELLSRIYEVKPSDHEFGLGCPLAIKEADLTECRYHFPARKQASPGARV